MNHMVETPSQTTVHNWADLIGEEKNKPYFQKLMQSITIERSQGTTIYPAQKDLFNAFKYTPLSALKVVIIGQDPYHGPGQAHGLCFSVGEHVRIPPSLQNIFQEIENDLGIPRAPHGHLARWAKQGVLLLNAVMSVKAGQPQSHAGRGWEQFTDTVIRQINTLDQPLVFMLWGSYAQKKGACIDTQKHLVLKTTHPSPLSAHRGFLGCKHFSQANAWLTAKGVEPIDW